MEKSICVSPDDIDTLLSVFPAWGGMTSAQRDMFLRLAHLVPVAGTEEGFYFPDIPANSQQKVSCIKALRTLTGVGLKEAKDAVEQETRFSLVGYNLTKEKVLEVVNFHSNLTHKMVVNFE